MSDDEAREWLRLMDKQGQERREQADLLLAVYRAASFKARRRVTLVEHFAPCRRSCPVLTVWQAPGPVRLVYLSHYKLSPTVNAAESSEDGRKVNTTDGDRRWKGSALFLDQLAEDVPMPVNCDHWRDTDAVPVVLADVAAGRPGTPIRRVLGRAETESR